MSFEGLLGSAQKSAPQSDWSHFLGHAIVRNLHFGGVSNRIQSKWNIYGLEMELEQSQNVLVLTFHCFASHFVRIMDDLICSNLMCLESISSISALRVWLKMYWFSSGAILRKFFQSIAENEWMKVCSLYELTVLDAEVSLEGLFSSAQKSVPQCH